MLLKGYNNASDKIILPHHFSEKPIGNLKGRCGTLLMLSQVSLNKNSWSISTMTPDNTTVYSHPSVCRPAETVPGGGAPAAPDTLWRRYSEFELLRTFLLVTYPYIIIPPLPEKRVSDS